MSTTAFAVRQTTDGVGTTDVTLRHIISALYPNKGIISGLGVSGRGAMNYYVAPGVAVCSKGSSDGNTLAYFEGGITPTLSSNSSSNPRIDAIWITSHDMTQGDVNNLVTIGATQGIPAVSPAYPSVPSYATVVGYMFVPAGATTTSGASQWNTRDYVIPYGGSNGILCNYVNTQDQHEFGKGWDGAWTPVSGSFDVPTDRLVSVTCTLTLQAVGSTDLYDNREASVIAYLYKDGAVVNCFEGRTFTNTVQNYSFTNLYEVEAGHHTVRMTLISENANKHMSRFTVNGWAGQRISVTDMGVIR